LVGTLRSPGLAYPDVVRRRVLAGDLLTFLE